MTKMGDFLAIFRHQNTKYKIVDVYILLLHQFYSALKWRCFLAHVIIVAVVINIPLVPRFSFDM